MNGKLKRLALWSFVLSFAIYLFSYMLYHHLDPAGGFTAVYQAVPAKPMITFLFAAWGVMHQSAGVLCLMAAHIIYPKTYNKKRTN